MSMASPLRFNMGMTLSPKSNIDARHAKGSAPFPKQQCSPQRRSPRIQSKTMKLSDSKGNSSHKTKTSSSRCILPVTPKVSPKKTTKGFYSHSRKINFDEPKPKKPQEMSPNTRMCFYRNTLKRLDKVKNRVQRALAQDMQNHPLKRQLSRDSLSSQRSFSKRAPKPKRRKQVKVLGSSSVCHGIKKIKPTKMMKKPITSLPKRLPDKTENVGLVITFNKTDKENAKGEQLHEDPFYIDNGVDASRLERKRKFFKSPGAVTLKKSMKLNDGTALPVGGVSDLAKKEMRKPLQDVNFKTKPAFQNQQEPCEKEADSNLEAPISSKSKVAGDVEGFDTCFGFSNMMAKEKENSTKPWRLTLTPVKSQSCVTEIEETKIGGDPEQSCPQWFPVFYKRDSHGTKDRPLRESPRKKIAAPKKEKDGKEQMLIDAGQKRWGSITCSECGVLYNPGEIDDEYEHSRFHARFLQHLKFPGWQNENVVANYLEGRVIMVSGTDSNFYWKKVEDILEIADRDLGFSEVGVRNKTTSKAFLYVSNRTVIGCLVAEKISSGFKVLGDEKDSAGESPSWRCSTVPRPVRCGVSRIWVAANHRRKGIATKLLDAMRSHFVYAEMLKKESVAFSDPTPMGMLFASKYSLTPSFLVYNK